MTGAFVPGDSALHRLPPAAKLTGLAVLAMALAVGRGLALPSIVAAASKL